MSRRRDGQLGLVLGNELRIATRDAKALALAALFPLVLFGFIGGIFALNADDSARERSTVVYVAVPEGQEAFAGLLRRAGGDAIEVETNADPERAVSLRKVDLGVVAQPDAVERIARGEPISARIIADGSRGKATVASPLLEAVLRRAALVGRVPPPPTPLVDVGRVDASRAPTAARSLIVRMFPSLVMLLCLPMAERARSRLLATRGDGSLEALWVLPVRRAPLLGGISLGVTLVGLASQLIVLLPATAIAGLVAAAGDGSVRVGASAVLSIVVAAVSTGFLMSCAGTALGAYGQATARASGVGPLITGVLFLVMTFVPLVQGLEDTPQLLPVPLLGAIVLVRRGIAGKLDPTDPLLVAGVAVAIGLFVLRSAVQSISQGSARNRAR